MKYKHKLILLFAIISCLCAAAIFAVEVWGENNYKRSVLQSQLEAYADIIEKTDSIDKARPFLPSNLRITVLDYHGNVHDDSYEDLSALDNHLARPEINDCLKKKYGYEIRYSETANQKYLYYAKAYPNRIIRVALPFEVSMAQYFRPDWVVLIAIGLLFIVIILLSINTLQKYDLRAKEEADKNERLLKHEMTSNIAHELKTPVSSIRGYLETLVNNPELDTEHRNLFIERSYLQTIRLSDLTRDIALVTKIEEAPELFKIEQIDLCRVVEDVLEEYKVSLTKKQMSAENDIPDGTLVKGCYPLLYALFRNLVENAVKYAGSESAIYISSRNKGNHLEIQFYDTGSGVEDNQIARIFDRFYRIPTDQSGKIEGSGLGLAIVRNTVLFHKGTIHASNRPAGGLQFDISIPMR